MNLKIVYSFQHVPRSQHLTYDPWIWSKVTSLSSTASILKDGRISLEITSFFLKTFFFSKQQKKVFLAISLSNSSFYSRVPNITVGLNKSVGVNFSWKLIIE